MDKRVGPRTSTNGPLTRSAHTGRFGTPEHVAESREGHQGIQPGWVQRGSSDGVGKETQAQAWQWEGGRVSPTPPTWSSCQGECAMLGAGGAETHRAADSSRGAGSQISPQSQAACSLGSLCGRWVDACSSR